jgi:predicted XRE-type DNA-binding protein
MAKRKIQPEDREKIRQLHQNGMMQKEIAQLYNVQPSRISLIVSTRFYDRQAEIKSVR